MKRLAIVTIVIFALLASGAAYAAAGWNAMESACSLSGPEGQTHESVSYSWSWSPLGFTCSYDDGTSETSLWPS